MSDDGTSDRPGTLEWLARAAAMLFSPLQTSLSSDELRKLLAVETGVVLAEGALDSAALTTALDQLATSAGQASDLITALTTALDSEDIAAATATGKQILDTVSATVSAVHNLPQALQGPFPGITAAELQTFSENLAGRLFEILAIRFINDYLVSRNWLLLLGLLDQALGPTLPGDDTQAYVREELHLERALQLASDPITHSKNIYGWGDAAFRSELLLTRLQPILERAGFTVTYTSRVGTTPASLQFLLCTIREHLAGPLPGIEIELSIPISSGLSLTLPVIGNFAAQITTTGTFDGGVKLIVVPPAELSWAATTSFSGIVQVSLVGSSDDPTKPFVLVGAAGSSRLEAKQLSVGVGLSATASPSSIAGDFLVSAAITGGHIVIDTSEGDGFLSRFLGSRHLEANLDTTLTWSPKQGLRFQGAAGLEAVVPINQTIGPLQFQTLYLDVTLDPSLAALPLDVSAAIAGKLGPVSVTVDRIGISTKISFPRAGGNLGPIDFQLGFKPPTGLGVVINADFVTGGGFVSFDTNNHQYTGVLDLEIADVIAIKALGVVTTRLPDGSKGYSLILILMAEDFPPIQLGFGFAITGIGGLFAVNRTFDETVFQAGLKNHTLDSILFAQDPVRNAPQIISTLNKAFPPADGHYLFGPMVKLVWGTPVLVTANIAVILEFGARLRMLVLAQIAAVLPKADQDLLRLQMDAVGVIDFDQGTASVDASLHDSRLLAKFALTGDMAARVVWKGTPSFAIAVGGVHPAFNPPPNFPKLERIAISLCSGDNPRIRCDAYFALTSNTEQFGAHAELYASASGFSIDGQIGFDVLIQLDPFSFVADFQAQIQLKHGSSNLFAVKVEGELSGPNPLHVRAKATFSVLWWDVSITVDRTLLIGDALAILSPLDIWPLLSAALNDVTNWIATLPTGQRPMVSLRTLPSTVGIAVHPLATLSVKQRVVPLDLDLAKFGQTTPTGARRFSVLSVTIGAHDDSPAPVRDYFAPAQFLELTDDEKLSRPSFELMNAGVTFGTNDVSFTDVMDDWLEVPTIEFETLLYDRATDSLTENNPGSRYTLTPERLLAQARFGAAGASELRRSSALKYRTTSDKYRVVAQPWKLVSTSDLSVKDLPGLSGTASFSEVSEAVAKSNLTEVSIVKTSDLT